MPFLTDEEIEESLNSTDNLTNRLSERRATIVHEEIVKKERGLEVPMEIKKIAAILTTQGSGHREVSRALGVGRSAVNSYAHGTTTGRPDNSIAELTEVIDATKDRRKEAEDQALDLMLGAMGLLTPAKLAQEKPKTISSIARDAAAIAESMREKKIGDQVQAVSFHLHAPPQKKLGDYDVIDS